MCDFGVNSTLAIYLYFIYYHFTLFFSKCIQKWITISHLSSQEELKHSKTNQSSDDKRHLIHLIRPLKWTLFRNETGLSGLAAQLQRQHRCSICSRNGEIILSRFETNGLMGTVCFSLDSLSCVFHEAWPKSLAQDEMIYLGRLDVCCVWC